MLITSIMWSSYSNKGKGCFWTVMVHWPNKDLVKIVGSFYRTTYNRPYFAAMVVLSIMGGEQLSFTSLLEDIAALIWYWSCWFSFTVDINQRASDMSLSTICCAKNCTSTVIYVADDHREIISHQPEVLLAVCNGAKHLL